MTGLPEPLEILGVAVHPVRRPELVEVLAEWSRGTVARRSFYVNVHAMNLSHASTAFRAALNNADLVFCDGFGVKLASRLLDLPLPERMTPPDWIDALLGRLDPGTGVYLLGDEDEVVAECARDMGLRHPNISVVGYRSGFFDPEGPEGVSVRDEIAQSGARVLLVGMGMPRQEYWIDRHLDDVNVALAMSVGALFRYYTRTTPRAPSWMTENGLEWLGRLFVEPRRLFERYLLGNPLFLWRVMRARFGR